MLSPRTLVPLLVTALFALTACAKSVPSVSVESASQATSGSSHPPAAPSLTPVQVPSQQSSAVSVPAFSHIYVIVMENQEFNSIVGSPNAPYLNSLVAQYGLATNYDAVSHPSEPNYLALFSGSTQGVTDDGRHDIAGQNLVDQLEAKGKTWKIYAQNLPSSCFTGMSASGGEDGPGTYARRHEPAISFTDISGSPTRCANITNLEHFDAGAGNFEFIAPNDCSNMHSCPIADGDTFLKGFVPKILTSAAWQQGGVVFIVWDEGTSNQGGGGHVPLIVISNSMQKGMRSGTAHNHYSLLRTIEDAWGLGCLNETCSANNLGEFFR